MRGNSVAMGTAVEGAACAGREIKGKRLPCLALQNNPNHDKMYIFVIIHIPAIGL